MDINPPEADFVSWGLCGNLFSAFGLKEQYNHPDHDYKANHVCFVSNLI